MMPNLIQLLLVISCIALLVSAITFVSILFRKNRKESPTAPWIILLSRILLWLWLIWGLVWWMTMYYLNTLSPTWCFKWQTSFEWLCHNTLSCPIGYSLTPWSNDSIEYSWMKSSDEQWVEYCEWVVVKRKSFYDAVQIENEWIKKCEQSDDYKQLQATYGEKNTWIKWYRVQESELYQRLSEIDEGFFAQPWCLIVMNGMWEGKIIQLELENLEPIFEMDLEEFAEKALLTDPDKFDLFLSKLETSDEIDERVAKAKLLQK